MNDYELYLVKRAYYKKQAYFTETPKKRKFNKALSSLQLSQKSLNNINKATERNKNNLELIDDYNVSGWDPYDHRVSPTYKNKQLWQPAEQPVSSNTVANIRRNINNPKYDATASLKSIRRQTDKIIKQEVNKNKRRQAIYNDYRDEVTPSTDIPILNYVMAAATLPTSPRVTIPKVYGRKAYKNI